MSVRILGSYYEIYPALATLTKYKSIWVIVSDIWAVFILLRWKMFSIAVNWLIFKWKYYILQYINSVLHLKVSIFIKPCVTKLIIANINVNKATKTEIKVYRITTKMRIDTFWNTTFLPIIISLKLLFSIKHFLHIFWNILQQIDDETNQFLLKDKEIEKWFEWKKGAKRYTIGIDITTEPFILKMHKDKEQRVILLYSMN